MGFCVVVFPAELEVGGYVAACVEKDIVTQGPTINEVHHEMEAALYLHVLLDLEAGLRPLDGVPEGLPTYRKAFMSAETDLGLQAIPFQGGSANDTPSNQKAGELLSGPRHYRYTDFRPQCPPTPWWF